MKKLSYWAKQNPRSARLFIALGRIFMAFAGLFYGLLLASFDQFWVMPMAVTAACMYLLAYVFYPRQQPVKVFAGHATWNYYRRKTCDALLVYSSFLVYVFIGNWCALTPVEEPSLPRMQVADASLERTSSIWSPSDSPHQTLKKAKKELRHTLREIRAARKNIDPAAMAGLMFFSVLLVIIAGILITLFSCRLACNGQEGAATLVILLGAVGVGLLLSLMWSAASRDARRKAAAKPDK